MVLAECGTITERLFRIEFLSTILFGMVDRQTLSGYGYRKHFAPLLDLKMANIKIFGIVPGEVPLGEDNFECIKFMRKVVRRHKAEILR